MPPRQAQPRQGLQGLAQSHVVGQDAAELVLLQKPQPGDTFLLVWAHDGSQVRRQGRGLQNQASALLAPDLVQPFRPCLDINPFQGIQ